MLGSVRRQATPPWSGAARCRAGPTLVHEVAASVTPRRRLASATVRDEHGAARGSAGPSGDVAGSDEVAVPSVPAVRARELSPLWLGCSLSAFGARRRGGAFVDPPHLDAGGFGLVGERTHEMSAAPLAQPQVLSAPGVATGNPGRVTDGKRAHTVFDRPGDDGLGGPVVRDSHSTAVSSLGAPLGGAQLAPSAAAPLAAPRCLRGHAPRPGLRVGEMEALLGANLTARDQQRLVTRGDRERVDDPYIDAGDSPVVKIVVFDGHGRRLEERLAVALGDSLCTDPRQVTQWRAVISRHHSWKFAIGRPPRRNRSRFTSIKAAQTSPPARNRPKQRLAWARVTRRRIRAVRDTEHMFGD